MTDNTATVQTTRLSGTTQKTIGYNKTNSKHFSGQISDLGTYRSHTKDHGILFLTTTEAIAAYVGTQFGKDMMLLIKHKTEKKFIEPILQTPTQAGDPLPPGVMEVWKAKLSIYHKDKKDYEDNKGQVFSIILGQCTQEVKIRLEAMPTFATWEIESDVVSLLTQLKSIAYTSDGVQHPYWVAQENLKKLAGLRQGATETVEKYYRRFGNITDVLDAHWGIFCPITLVKGKSSATNDDKKEAREQLFAMMFLAGSDRQRFGNLLDDYSNSYVGGLDNYPKTMDAAVTLLGNYARNLKHVPPTSSHKFRNDEGTTSFAQNTPAAKCTKCGRAGHTKTTCTARVTHTNSQTSYAGRGSAAQKARRPSVFGHTDDSE